MFRKFTTKTLVILFTVLLGLLLVSNFFESRKGERTFKSELVSIDSASAKEIESILIYPQSENYTEIKLTNSGLGKWQAKKNEITGSADSNAVKGLLQSLLQLKSLQLASNDKNSWKDYNVNDSLGTRVKILNKENETLADIVIGRFAYNQNTRSGSTYVRLYDENEVYTVEGFLSMNVNQKFEQWRIKTIVAGKYESWNKLTFKYPNDSGFVLMKQNNKWKVDTTTCDSLKMTQYLSRLANLHNSIFIDSFKADGKSPALSLKIEGDSLSSPITINAYEADPANRYIVNSSMNPDSYFKGLGGLYESIFVNKNKFEK